MPLAEPLRRNADPDADWETPLGQCDHLARIYLASSSSFVLSHDYTAASPCPAAWRPRPGPAMLAPCVAALVSPPM